MNNYTEIFKLKEMLEKENIQFEFVDTAKQNMINYGGITAYQIAIPKNSKERIISIIQGDHTYGGQDDLLEIMGLLTAEELKDDEVCGGLTAENVFERITKAIK